MCLYIQLFLKIIFLVNDDIQHHDYLSSSKEKNNLQQFEYNEKRIASALAMRSRTIGVRMTNNVSIVHHQPIMSYLHHA